MNHSQGLESTMMLMEFLHQGWRPDGIDLPDLDLLFLTSIELKGEFDLLPVIPVDAEVTFKMHPNSIAHAVEQTFTLTMGTEYPEKLYFKDMATKEEHWMQINSVYLLDMWEDMNRKFDDPKFKEHMTPEQIARTRRSLEEHLPDVCPKGMCIPVIEYECEEGISLQFYTKAHLDAVPECKNGASSIGFIGSPDKETGVLGMKLKAAFLPEAVSANTEKIEVELFQYNCLSKTREFTI